MYHFFLCDQQYFFSILYILNFPTDTRIALYIFLFPFWEFIEINKCPKLLLFFFFFFFWCPGHWTASFVWYPCIISRLSTTRQGTQERFPMPRQGKPHQKACNWIFVLSDFAFSSIGLFFNPEPTPYSLNKWENINILAVGSSSPPALFFSQYIALATPSPFHFWNIWIFGINFMHMHKRTHTHTHTAPVETLTEIVLNL